jgi:hypothetical protein
MVGRTVEGGCERDGNRNDGDDDGDTTPCDDFWVHS